jgi:hypothetical protein
MEALTVTDTIVVRKEDIMTYILLWLLGIPASLLFLFWILQNLF